MQKASRKKRISELREQMKQSKWAMYKNKKNQSEIINMLTTAQLTQNFQNMGIAYRL